MITLRKEGNQFQSPKDGLTGAEGHQMLALLSGLGTRPLSALLCCTSDRGRREVGGWETLTLAGEEKEVACTRHGINILNREKEEAHTCMCSVESELCLLLTLWRNCPRLAQPTENTTAVILSRSLVRPGYLLPRGLLHRSVLLKGHNSRLYLRETSMPGCQFAHTLPCPGI